MTDYLIKEDVFMALTGDITDCTIEEFIARLRDKLSKLPSVTPKEKTGKWIPLGNYDEWGNENSYKCSECGERNFYPDNYCHNCGAKMQEVENDTN